MDKKDKKFSLYGNNFFGGENKPIKGVISQKFTVAPFSVLNTREGMWQS